MNYNRRQQGINKARKIKFIWNSQGYLYLNESDRYFKKLIKTRKQCTNLMCANPRKLGEITRQEKLANIRDKD